MSIEKNALSARKLVGRKLRKAGFPDDLSEFRANSLGSKDECLKARNKLAKIAREHLDTLKDSMEPEELRDFERAHDALMATFDLIDDRLNDLSDNPARPIFADASCRGVDDGSVSYADRSGWSDRQSNEIRVLAPRDKMATGERWTGPGLGDCLRALVTGPRNDAERRALEEGTTTAGGFTVPTPLALEFFDRLRARSVVMRAGARTVDMTSETLAMAKLATDPTVAWRAESAEISASDPTFGRVLMTAKSMASLVRVSRELLEDSVNVSAMLEMAFTRAVALEFDRAALYGTGQDDQPEGVAIKTGINSVEMATDGANLLGYDKVIDAIYELQVDNAADPTAMVFHPRTGKNLAKVLDGEGNPVHVPKMVADIPQLVTTSVPITQTQGTATNASSIVMGDFTELLIGIRSALRIEVLRERYGEFLQYGFVAHMRGDVQTVHDESFCVLKGITPPA